MEDSQERSDTLMLMLTEKLSQSISNQDTKLGLDTALVLNLLKLLIISALHLSNIIKSAMMVMEPMELALNQNKLVSMKLLIQTILLVQGPLYNLDQLYH